MAKKQQEVKIFALDYQVKGVSYIYGGGKLMPLEGQDKVAEWIAKLPTDAVVITEQGGATDGPIYRLVNRGVEVHYVPTTYENLARTEYGVSGKKEDAKVLWRMFHEGYARNFHRHTPTDDAVVRLSLLYNTYTGLIADRVAAQNRVTATYTRSAWFVAGDEESIQEFIDVSCTTNPAFAATTTEEESYKKELERLVGSMPIYKTLIAPITGIGPRIGAAMIVYLKQAERFFDPDNPASLGIAQKRWGEYSGLDGEAFTVELLAARRTGGSCDIGVPGLKAVLHLTAEQFVRQQGSPLRSVYDIRKWKEFCGMLDILLNSKTEAELIFDTKNGGDGEGFGIGPVELAHKRASRYLKQLWGIKYWFPYAHKFQKCALPEDFDANQALATVATRDIELTLKCIRRDSTLRLARQSYERPPKGGKISYQEWPTVIELGSPSDLNHPDMLREFAIEQMIADVEQELAEMQALESKKQNGGKYKSAKAVQEKIGRLVQLIDILQSRRLNELPNRGRQLICESHGIGRPIIDFIDRHVPILAEQIQVLQAQQEVAVAPVRTRLEELKTQRDAMELEASELQGEFRRAQRTKDAPLIADAKARIAEADLTRRIAEVREEMKASEKDLSKLRKDHNKEMDNLISGFKPDLADILNADPRLLNRSKRDRQYVETLIWSVIQHRAEFGLSL